MTYDPLKSAIPAKSPAHETITEYLSFDDNSAFQELCGLQDSHLALLEATIGLRINARGNKLTLLGGPDAVARTGRILTKLYQKVKSGHSLSPADVDAAIRLSVYGDEENDKTTLNQDNINSISLQKRTISPRSPAQAAYLTALQEHELVFGVGPAGTGKTYLAVAWAAHLLLQGKVERIILSRPALEAGEQIGFLPGDMKDKVDPYLRPLYDALYDVFHTDFTDRRIAAGDIEIAPLGFMRGRTLSRSAIILDEAQNATIAQMKMFLTRLGEDSKMVITGDPSQSDLPGQSPSGLPDALQLLRGVKGVGVAQFTAADVVRHKLVARIVTAYEKREAARRKAQMPNQS